MHQLLKCPSLSLKTALVGCFLAAFFRIHLRVETTRVGYEIGRLKTQEGRLLEERSELKMELARLTTKQRLSQIASDEPSRSGSPGRLASK